MTAANIWEMAVFTVKQPKDAARQLLALDIPREALWTALALMGVLNAIVYAISNLLFPVPGAMPAFLAAPAVYAVIVVGGLALTALSLSWAGRAMGGVASLENILVLVIWLQVLRLMVQIAATILMLIVPAFAGLLVIAAAFVGLWILINFVDVAQKFDSPGKAFGSLIFAFLGMVVALSLILSLIGASTLGLAPNV